MHCLSNDNKTKTPLNSNSPVELLYPEKKGFILLRSIHYIRKRLFEHDCPAVSLSRYVNFLSVNKQNHLMLWLIYPTQGAFFMVSP
jgi:hypothetical protein